MAKISNDLKSEEEEEDDDDEEEEEDEDDDDDNNDEEVLANKENVKVEKKRSSKINEGNKETILLEEGDASISSSSRVRCELKVKMKFIQLNKKYSHHRPVMLK